MKNIKIASTLIQEITQSEKLLVLVSKQLKIMKLAMKEIEELENTLSQFEDRLKKLEELI